jgi:DNA-binding transcriptional MerR regulator
MSLAAHPIPEKIFFKIGEVCDLVGVQPHVLRYWETEFPMLSPQKNRAGQRTYRRRDVEIAMRIKELLYQELYTIAGAKKRLSIELREQTRLKVVSNSPETAKTETPRSDFQINSYVEPAAPTKPVFNQPPVVKQFPPPVFNQPEEDFDARLAAAEFDADEVSSEKRAALASLKKQLGELMQILEREEPSVRRRW